MGDRAKDTPPESRSLRLKRSVAGALGLGAAGLLASAPAEAATELAQLADSDGRLGILLTLFVPVVGWVLFNIAGPAFSQLDVSASWQCGSVPWRAVGDLALTLTLAPHHLVLCRSWATRPRTRPPRRAASGPSRALLRVAAAVARGRWSGRAAHLWRPTPRVVAAPALASALARVFC